MSGRQYRLLCARPADAVCNVFYGVGEAPAAPLNDGVTCKIFIVYLRNQASAVFAN